MKPLPAMIGLMCAAAWQGSAGAQALPRRANVESTAFTAGHKALGEDRHHLEVRTDAPALLSFESNSGLADLELLHGPLPRVLASPGGALFADAQLQRLGETHWLVDSGVQERGWLLLEPSGATASDVVVEMRSEARHGYEDPWKVALFPASGGAVARRRSDRRDHAVALDGVSGARFLLPGAGPQLVRFDLWRPQLPRQLPPDATWLRILADGRVIFDARVPPVALREQLFVSNGCAEVLDLAGRLQLSVPPGTRELLVAGESGVQLKLTSSLPGTPDSALSADADPAQQRLLRQPGESLRDAFNRAVDWFPDPRAQRHLARHSYYRPTMIWPTPGEALQTRNWRARYPQRRTRAPGASNAAHPGVDPVATTQFHWIAAGAGWTINMPAEDQLALLRVSVAHPEASAQTVQLVLEQPGAAGRRLRLDPQAVAALAGAAADDDGLLALLPDAGPVIDASAVVLKVMDVRTPLTLTNIGASGAWVAVEQRVPAPVRLATEAVAGPATTTPARLRAALLDAPQPSAVAEAYDLLGDTRAITRTRDLLLSRERTFRADRCFIDTTSRMPGQSRIALQVLESEQDADPVLARCALWQAAALEPGSVPVGRAVDAWALRNGRPDVRTGFVVGRLRQGTGREDAALWHELVAALQAEGDPEGAALARLAADAVRIAPGPAASAERAPTRSSGLVRLQADRDLQLSYWSGTPDQVLEWTLDAGDYALELRSTAPAPDVQWAELASGELRWHAALPAAETGDDAATRLRNIADGQPPGSAVRLSLHASEGAVLRVHSRDAALLGRLVMQPALPQPGFGLEPAGREQAVQIAVAARCDVAPVRTRLRVIRPPPPGDRAAPTPGGARISLAQPTPAIPHTALPGVDEGEARIDDPTQAALAALWLLTHDRPEPGRVAAGWALHRRDQTRAASTDAGVFAMLESRLRWRSVPPSSSAGTRRRMLADGHSDNPLLARRNALAGAPPDQEILLQAGRGWVLEGLAPEQRVRLRVRHYAPLPRGQARLSMPGGKVASLQVGEAKEAVGMADSEGQLRFRLDDGMPGSVVGLAVMAVDGTPIDARLPRTYHLATAERPLRLTVQQPTYLRIVEWDGQRSAVRMQWVGAGEVALHPAVLPAAALRVSQLTVVDSVRTRDEPAVLQPGAAPPAGPPAAPPPHVPGAGHASTWPAAWPQSGGEDHTWGFVAGAQQRTDADAAVIDASERSTEARWRYRFALADLNWWGRLDVIGRRNASGYAVGGLEQSLEWRQPDGPWGVDLDLEYWRQDRPAGLGATAESAGLRASLQWEQKRDDRWSDRLHLAARWRHLSLSAVPIALAALLDDDVYTRYRDDHPNQLNLGYALSYRARYDTQWAARTYVNSNPVAERGIDNAGVGLEWQWSRHGWQASASLDARQYFADAARRRARHRERIDVDVGRWVLSADHGWRMRASGGYDLSQRTAFGGISVEWFDHDGRGFDDFLPSELALRGVLETDLHSTISARDDDL